MVSSWLVLSSSHSISLFSEVWAVPHLFFEIYLGQAAMGAVPCRCLAQWGPFSSWTLFGCCNPGKWQQATCTEQRTMLRCWCWSFLDRWVPVMGKANGQQVELALWAARTISFYCTYAVLGARNNSKNVALGSSWTEPWLYPGYSQWLGFVQSCGCQKQPGKVRS